MCPGLSRLMSVAFFLLTARTVSSSDEYNKAEALVQCFERHNCFTAERTAWHHFIDDLASCQTGARVWWSSKPDGIPVTLVTQLSVTRMEQLKAQCATWGGPLAAAIFLPLINPQKELSDESKKQLVDSIGTVDALFRASEANRTHGCQLRLVLMYELFNDTRAATMLYPVNSLRNYARLMADTDLITNIDVDLLPSVSISAALANPQILANYTKGCRGGAVYVWPAFETHCNGTEYADRVAMGGRMALQEGLKDCVTIFEYKYPVFHGPTNYSRWYATHDEYQVTYSFNYEPWYLSWRWSTRWFDIRYRGYGYNKIVQAAAMNASGAKWLVSPHGFVLHRPHEHTRMRKQFVHEKVSHLTVHELHDTMYGHVEELWEAAKVDISSLGRLEVCVEKSFQECVQSLPWWQNLGWRRRTSDGSNSHRSHRSRSHR